jgi:hypothetical protein
MRMFSPAQFILALGGLTPVSNELKQPLSVHSLDLASGRHAIVVGFPTDLICYLLDLDGINKAEYAFM